MQNSVEIFIANCQNLFSLLLKLFHFVGSRWFGHSHIMKSFCLLMDHLSRYVCGFSLPLWIKQTLNHDSTNWKIENVLGWKLKDVLTWCLKSFTASILRQTVKWFVQHGFKQDQLIRPDKNGSNLKGGNLATRISPAFGLSIISRYEFLMKIDEQKFWISKFSEFYIKNKVLRKKLSWNPEI